MKLSKALVLKKALVLGNRLAPAAPKPLLRWCKLREGLGVLHRPKTCCKENPATSKQTRQRAFPCKKNANNKGPLTAACVFCVGWRAVGLEF